MPGLPRDHTDPDPKSGTAGLSIKAALNMVLLPNKKKKKKKQSKGNAPKQLNTVNLSYREIILRY